MELSDDVSGYFDGRDLTTPSPTLNRSFIYRHCWLIGRREKLGKPIIAWRARIIAERAIERDEKVYM